MDKETRLSTAMLKIFEIQQKIHVEKGCCLKILAEKNIEFTFFYFLLFLLF